MDEERTFSTATLENSLDGMLSSLHATEPRELFAPAARETIAECCTLLEQRIRALTTRVGGLARFSSLAGVNPITRDFEAVSATIESDVVQWLQRKILSTAQDELHGVFATMTPPTRGTPNGNGPRGGRRSDNNGQNPALAAFAARHTFTPMDEPLAEPQSNMDALTQTPENHASIRLLKPEPAPEPKPTTAVAAHAQVETDCVDTEMYTGSVKLEVVAGGAVWRTVQFVEGLRQKPQLRLLQLIGKQREGVTVWLGLREAVCLKSLLLTIDGVSQVVSVPAKAGAEDAEHVLKVVLAQETSERAPALAASGALA